MSIKYHKPDEIVSLIWFIFCLVSHSINVNPSKRGGIMGKILDTTYHETIENITSFYGKLINNSFYDLNDKKPTIVTYYNINKTFSSLDPAAKIHYDNVGDSTPLRFNKIADFILYGINRVELQTSIEEFGIESDRITGDAFILPNTIIPTEGDFFEITYVKDSTWLFIVNDVQQDTLKNGSNVYKINYRLNNVDHDKIKNNLVGNYRLIEKREGTNIVRIVEETNYITAKKLDAVAVKLKTYFNELFYNEKVQTYTYVDLTEWRMYDPYMIEFLIRNQIMSNGEYDYIHVCHQLNLPKTFVIDYDNTIFRAFECKDLEMLRTSIRSIVAEEIVSYGTTFYARYETYFRAKYIRYTTGYSGTSLEDELYYRILNGELVTEDEVKDENCKFKLWLNILIRHFQDANNDKITITEEELQSLNTELVTADSMRMFYLIPLLILALEMAIEKALT